MDPTWEDAAKHGDVDVARQLLLAGREINARDRYGQTGLMLAAHRGHQALLELLIENGADLNVTAKYGLSALMLAIVSGHKEIALRLVRAGADLGLRGKGSPGFIGKTAYDLAVEREMKELYEALKPR